MRLPLGLTLARLRRAAPERQRLLLEMAALDDRYEAGDIPEAEHRRRRASAKARLLGGASPADAPRREAP